MALKVNNQPNTQSISVGNPLPSGFFVQPSGAGLQSAGSAERATPPMMWGRQTPLQGSFAQPQQASGNMAAPTHAPPQLGPQHYMSTMGLPAVSYPGPWHYSLIDGGWAARGTAQLDRMKMPRFPEQQPLPIYTRGQ